MDIIENFDLIYQAMQAALSDGKLAPINGKAPEVTQWENATVDEKLIILMAVADHYNVPFANAAVNASAARVISEKFLSASETVSTLETNCNLCGKDLRITKITQFDTDENGDKITEDNLYPIICHTCAI